MRGADPSRALRPIASGLLSLLTAACGAHGGAKGPAVWRYDVAASPGATDLTVVASFPRGSDSEMIVAERADTFVVGVSVEQPHDKERPWLEVHRFGQLWKIPACTSGCRVRYRYLLADGAGTWNDISLGAKEDGVTLAPPSTWLLRPAHAPEGTALRFHVTSPPGETFVSGVFPAPDAPASDRVYEAHVGDFLQLPYSAFGPLTVHELGGGTATLALLPGSVPEAKVVAWAERSLAAVRGFYGRAPAPHVLILVRGTAGDDVGSGSTMGYSGASVVVNVGSETTDAGFLRDWVLVHELVHTALPDLPEEQHWLEEGLATYVEPLARYRAGILSAEDVWGEWAEKMRLGEPEDGDEGLDKTHTWGRTYWGGALFCLAADVEIRVRTHGKASLETGLRGIVDAGGNIGETWTTEKVIEVADRATGATVIRETYDKLARTSAPVDLTTLWRRLGVVAHGSGPVTFDDSADLAWVRKLMTPPR